MEAKGEGRMKQEKGKMKQTLSYMESISTLHFGCTQAN